MWYLHGGFIILSIKIIKNSNIYNWIIIITTKISINAKFDLFEMLKVSHLMMLYPYHIIFLPLPSKE
jgi:hypothetical protein